MKVICIDGNWNKGPRPVSTNCPKESEIVTVICDFNGWYLLEEYDNNILWEAENFAPLSDIDETEMERNYELNQAELQIREGER